MMGGLAAVPWQCNSSAPTPQALYVAIVTQLALIHCKPCQNENQSGWADLYESLCGLCNPATDVEVSLSVSLSSQTLTLSATVLQPYKAPTKAHQ